MLFKGCVQLYAVVCSCMQLCAVVCSCMQLCAVVCSCMQLYAVFSMTALAAILIPKLPGYMGGGGTANFLLITMHFFMKRPPISKYHSLKMFLKQSRKSAKQVGFNSMGNPGY